MEACAAASLASLPEWEVLNPVFCDAVLAPTPRQAAALAARTDIEEQMRQAYGVEAFADGLTGISSRTPRSGPAGNIAGLLSGCNGEGMKTVLPAGAMAKMDFRLVPEQDPKTSWPS